MADVAAAAAAMRAFLIINQQPASYDMHVEHQQRQKNQPTNHHHHHQNQRQRRGRFNFPDQDNKDDPQYTMLHRCRCRHCVYYCCTPVLATYLHLAYAAPMAALLSRQKPLLFMPGFFQKDEAGTDPLQTKRKTREKKHISKSVTTTNNRDR